MRIEAAEEIALGIDEAFRQATDVEALERRAIRRGIEVQRLSDGAPEDLSWRITGEIADARREAEVQISHWVPPGELALLATTDGLRLNIAVRFTPLTARRTRVTVGMDFSARGLKHRMALATLSLARSRIAAWLGRGLASLVKDMEQRAGV